MSTPTIEQRCEAQKWANYSIIPSVDRTHLLTADELRAVLVEGEEQARLLGMSAERECALRGKLEQAERHANRVNDANDRLTVGLAALRDDLHRKASNRMTKPTEPATYHYNNPRLDDTLFHPGEEEFLWEIETAWPSPQGLVLLRKYVEERVRAERTASAPSDPAA